VVVIGEVLWDVFPAYTCLGGAPLNFAVNAKRLGLRPLLISAVGPDELGERATRDIKALGLDCTMLSKSAKWSTGTASVSIDSAGNPVFRIARPAAYDDVPMTSHEAESLAASHPSWLYYGTLFASVPETRATLERLFQALPGARRFYDVNLRPGFESMTLVADLLSAADVVKLNESEAEVVARHFALPQDLRDFCHAGSQQFGWTAVCITLGERGCVIYHRGDFAQADGEVIQVADTVGAGDASAAAFLHGLNMNWPVARIARFANRVGAVVASREGATPDWTILEVAIA